MNVLVVANGEPPSADLLRDLADRADLVVAADGGARHAFAAGVTPDYAVGDLDSLTAEERSQLGPLHVVLDPDPDRTDLQKAIDFALQRGATSINIAGAGGSRADHALANLSVLVLYRSRARLALIDDLFEVSLVDGESEVDAPPGTVVSLIAIGRAEGVTTSGLRWDLSDHTLTFGTYGVHNEVAAPPARINVRSGDLLLFTGRFIEPHA
jgi:thiamine pyrophosphokinase